MTSMPNAEYQTNNHQYDHWLDIRIAPVVLRDVIVIRGMFAHLQASGKSTQFIYSSKSTNNYSNKATQNKIVPEVQVNSCSRSSLHSRVLLPTKNYYTG